MLKELTLTTKNQENVANNGDNCCTPLYQPQISREQAESAAILFAALADPTRLSILNMLAASHAEVCVCDITGSFQLGQPTISHHLRILKEAGLVSGDKRGKWVYYSLVSAKVAEVKAMLQKVLD
jgi:ArsR family transcriptional regulator